MGVRFGLVPKSSIEFLGFISATSRALVQGPVNPGLRQSVRCRGLRCLCQGVQPGLLAGCYKVKVLLHYGAFDPPKVLRAP